MPETTSFHNILLPRRYSYGAQGGPAFNTTVLVSQSGVEQRNVNWLNTRAKYDLTFSVQEIEDLQELLAFYRVRRGRAYSFRFWDPMDYLFPPPATVFLLGVSMDFTSGTPDTIRWNGGSWAASGIRIGHVMTFSSTINNNGHFYVTGFQANASGVIDTIEVAGFPATTELSATTNVVGGNGQFDIPVGDGSRTLYQIVKRYHSGPLTDEGPNVYERNITKLVRTADKQGSVEGILTIGVSLTTSRTAADTEVIVDFDTGLVDLSLSELGSHEMTIGAITKANPAVVTVSHDMTPVTGDTTRGLVNGETIWIKDCLGMTQANNKRYAVRNIAYGGSTTFELENLNGNSTNSTLWGVYAGFGKATKILQGAEAVRFGDSAEFDVHVRFDTDLMDVEAEYFDAANWRAITLVEIP